MFASLFSSCSNFYEQIGRLSSKKVSLSRVLTQLELLLQNTRKHWYKVDIDVNMIILRKASFRVGRKWWWWRYGWRLIAIRLESQYVCCCFLLKRNSCIQCIQYSSVLNLFYVNKKNFRMKFSSLFRFL